MHGEIRTGKIALKKEILNLVYLINLYCENNFCTRVIYFACDNKLPSKPNPTQKSSEKQCKDLQLFFIANITTPTVSHIKGLKLTPTPCL